MSRYKNFENDRKYILRDYELKYAPKTMQAFSDLMTNAEKKMEVKFSTKYVFNIDLNRKFKRGYMNFEIFFHYGCIHYSYYWVHRNINSVI